MTDPAEAFDARPSRRIEAILFLTVPLFPFVQLGVASGLPDLTERLGSTPSETVWVMSAFLLACAVFAPLIGCLGDILGRKRMLVVTVCLVTIGSVIGLIGVELWQIVAGRVLQGAVAGIFPLAFSLARELLPHARHAPVIGLMTAITGLGAGVSLLCGGIFTDLFTYRAVFVFNLLGAVTVLVCALLLPRSCQRLDTARIDVAGAVLFGGGMFLIMLVVTEIGTWAENPARAILFGSCGVAALAALVRVERYVQSPLLNVRVLRIPAVLGINLSTLLINIAGFVVFVLVPQFAETDPSAGYGFGSSATGVGALLLPGAALTLFAGPLLGQLGNRIGHHRALAISALLVAIGMAGLALSMSMPLVFFAMAGVSLAGLNLAFGAMTNGIIAAVPPENVGEGTGTNSLVRTVGNALGSQLSAGILAIYLISPDPGAAGQGYMVAFIVCAIVAVAGAVAALAVRATIRP